MPVTFPAEKVWIDEIYVYKHTELNEAVDPNFIYPAVYQAQKIDLRSYLGDSLYAKINTDVADDTLSGDYLTLFTDYIAPALLWWTMVRLMPSLTYKIDNGTIIQRQSEDAVPVSNRVMQDMMYRMRHNAETHTNRLQDYLCGNSADFVEYGNNVYPQVGPIRKQRAILQVIVCAGTWPVHQQPLR